MNHNPSLVRAALVASSLLAISLVAGCDKNKSDGQAASGQNASMGVVNAKCPMQPNSAVNPGAPTAEWQGQKIGFCCPGCANAWSKLDDTQKADRLAKAK